MYTYKPLWMELALIGLVAYPVSYDLWQKHSDTPFRMSLSSSPMDMMPIKSTLIRIPMHHPPDRLYPPEWHHLEKFYASRSEINNQLFSQFLNETRVQDGNYPSLYQRASGKWAVRPASWNHPVSGVTHGEALDFCIWLSEKTGWDISLPNAFHWRAMTQADRPGLRFPWGWTQPQSSTVAYTLQRTRSTLRQLPSTPFHHIVGNVYEWGESTSPSNAIIRGGAWSDKAPEMLDVNLAFEQPRTLRSADIGFRVIGYPPTQ